MTLPADPMRRVAWLLVLVGLAVAALSPVYAHLESGRLYRAWLDDDKHEPPCMTPDECTRVARRTSEKIRMMTNRLRPTWTVASPWPAVYLGAGVSAFGLLLLAIRRPLPPAAVPLAVLALLVAGCSGNSMRNAYQPVALNGQSAQALDDDNVACRAIGYRAGQGLNFRAASGNEGLVFAGAGAGTLAAGSTGGAAGTGAGVVIGSYQNIYERGVAMHVAYRACMRDRGYRGAQEAEP